MANSEPYTELRYYFLFGMPTCCLDRAFLFLSKIIEIQFIRKIIKNNFDYSRIFYKDV